MVYGYARCSTNEELQDINRQVRALLQLGVPHTNIFNSGDKSVTINDILLSEIEANDTKAEGLFIDKVGLPFKKRLKHCV